MGDEEAKKIWADVIRHDGRIAALEEAMSEQKPLLQATLAELGRLSSYNMEVASGMRKTLYGNGNPGLVTVVTQLIERTESRKETHDKDMSRVDRIFCWGGAGLVSVLIGIIAYLVKLHFGG
jgi:hypothetical protein